MALAECPTIYANLEIMDANYVLEESGQQTLSIAIPLPQPNIESRTSNNQGGTSKRKPAKNQRTRNPENWLVNLRKQQRQRGEDYVDRKGRPHRARRVGEGCGATCRLQCGKTLSTEDREKIHRQFWELNDEQKWHFYSVYVERWIKDRQRAKTESVRKKYTYNYYLQKEDGMRERVCKTFFLRTLDISQKRLYFFHEKVRTPSGLPRAPLRGKMGSRATPEEQVEQVRDHIRTFTRLPPPPGHIPGPTEEFLDAKISIRRMYELYREIYRSQAVKENVYRKILKNNFNIRFIKRSVS